MRRGEDRGVLRVVDERCMRRDVLDRVVLHRIERRVVPEECGGRGDRRRDDARTRGRHRGAFAVVIVALYLFSSEA